MDGRKFGESEVSSEEAFEKIVKEHSKRFFGTKTIYCDIKSKIDTKFSGDLPFPMVFFLISKMRKTLIFIW